MSLGMRYIKALEVSDSTLPLKRRRGPPWRLIGLCLAFGVSGLIWLAIFWAVGYFL